ncbi:MAG: DNA cytosine methyltransferase [Alphaproteobacteria bacterium]
MSRDPAHTFYEFFAGGGMARLGLGDGWRCLFANDFDPLKAATYRANFEDADSHLRQGDIWALTPEDLPGAPDLAWASSPCQDFSLAGSRAGLAGGRSSAFFGFWKLMQGLAAEDRAPRVIVIENVTGLLTSHGGADFEALCAALHAQGYRFGALEIDAGLFTPQSRPRVFVVAMRHPSPPEGPSPFHTRGVRAAFERLSPALKQAWVWWSLAAPARRNADLASMLEPDGVCAWRTADQTAQLLNLMDSRNRAKVDLLAQGPSRHVGTVFRRIRAGRQRAEVRFDGVAGCLRTPGGGSSRQLLLLIEDGEVKSRWLTAREGARLMGLADDYLLPRAQSPGLKVIGDGVVVPVVRHLTAGLLEPLLMDRAGKPAAA